MNWKTVLFGGGILAGAYLLLTQFSKGIATNFQGLKWMGREGLRLRFALLYSVENRNDIPLTVSRLEGKLRYGDYRLNDVIVDKAVTVAPGATEQMEVIFSVSPGVVLAEILRFVEEKSGFKRFRLTGKMTGKIGDIPFVYPLNENLGLAE